MQENGTQTNSEYGHFLRSVELRKINKSVFERSVVFLESIKLFVLKLNTLNPSVFVESTF